MHSDILKDEKDTINAEKIEKGLDKFVAEARNEKIFVPSALPMKSFLVQENFECINNEHGLIENKVFPELLVGECKEPRIDNSDINADVVPMFGDGAQYLAEVYGYIMD